MFGKEIHECTPIFMGHVDRTGEGISMRPIGDPGGGIVRKWFQSFVYWNHERISWVSIEIYYHDNFVFGHIFMFLTSIFAHFCVLCTYLVGKQQEAYGESNHGMLFICSHMLWS